MKFTKMFEAETEDMLPRTAPKPNAELEQIKASAMPTVPEVSIVFGQQEASVTTAQMSSTQNYPPETYASWKKKVLPSAVPCTAETLSTARSTNSNLDYVPARSTNSNVDYVPARSTNSNVDYLPARSTNSNVEYVPAPRSTLFPMRAAVNTISTNPSLATTGVEYSSHADTYQFRRSWDNPPNTPVYAYTHDSGGYFGSVNNIFHPMYQQQRRSLDAIPPRNVNTISPLAHQQELLTICAGTQTDSSLDATGADFATKQDVQQLLGIMQDMHAEQVRMRQLCEAMVMQKQQQESFAQTKVKDAEVQCDLVEAKTVNNDPPFPLTNGHKVQNELSDDRDDAELQLRIDNFYKPVKSAPVYEDNSQRILPAAQSTAYRPNTPRAVRPAPAQQQSAPLLSKPTTEKSMAMNELALKYLPSEKLHELMQDMQLNNNTPAAALPKPVTPLRELEQLDKGVNDLSNASYRYLKKYRLLPEEQQQRQTTPEKVDYGYQSPYHVASPLAAANGASPYEHEAMLDLEHLRNQPKYL